MITSAAPDPRRTPVEERWGEATAVRAVTVVLLAGMYAWAVLGHPDVRHPSPLELLTGLMAVHALAYWLRPQPPVGLGPGGAYLVLQALVVGALGSLVRDALVTAALTLVLCADALLLGRTDWRASAPWVSGVVVVFLLVLTEAGTAHVLPALLLVAACLPCMAVVGSVLVGLARARQEAQAALRELAIAREHDRIRAAERQRMARDLHDTLAQGVAGLVLQLEAVDAHLARGHDGRAREIVVGALGRARSTLGEARQAIEGLRSDDMASLRLVVEGEVAEFGHLSPVPCAVEMPSDVPLTDRQSEQVRHLLREALGNVARHARARHVTVSAGVHGPSLRVEVADDGCGFDADAADGVPGHYGLRGLRERAALAGGELEVETAPGAGTVVRLLVPRPASR